MNKQDLISAVAAQTGFTKKDVTVVVDSVFDVIANALANEDIVKISGFGQFIVKERVARTTKSLQTGEPITIPATKTPGFKASSALKSIVKGI